MLFTHSCVLPIQQHETHQAQPQAQIKRDKKACVGVALGIATSSQVLASEPHGLCLWPVYENSDYMTPQRHSPKVWRHPLATEGCVPQPSSRSSRGPAKCHSRYLKPYQLAQVRFTASSLFCLPQHTALFLLPGSTPLPTPGLQSGPGPRFSPGGY